MPPSAVRSFPGGIFSFFYVFRCVLDIAVMLAQLVCSASSMGITRCFIDLTDELAVGA